ncbi:MAG TPA: DUF222 domain-containing protein [Actinopolymorphaceae bacterium]
MMTTGTTPAAGVDHPVAHALVDALGLLRPVADPGEIRLWQLGDDQCLTTMLTVQHVESVVAAIKLQLLGVMEERQVTQHATNLGTAAWLNGTTASSLQAAYRETGLARGLHRRFPAIVTAMAAGAVSAEQADAIVRVLKKLPENLSVEQLQAAEAMMIGFAADHGPKGLRDLARHLLNVIAPEIAETAEAAMLEAQDREARKNQYLRLRDDGDGAVTIAGKLPAADGEALRAVVDAIAHSTKTAGDASWAEPGLSSEARRAQALMTLVHAYSTGGHGPRHGGDRPRVTVLVNYEDLLRGVAGATLLGSNTRISPSEARRLACDADILPAVLGSDSQLLDLGRTTRLFAGDLRQAIMLRDRGCVFPGCHRDPRDCDAHHITPWTANGPTSLDNGALLCPTHHRLVEPDPHADRATDHERWHMRMSADGIPEVIPPSINDQHRQPQRHKRFHLQRC